MKSTFLYRLLRPEFVKRWKVPLSSDAFSQFGKDYESQKHNDEVREATNALETIEIPAFAKHYDQLRDNKEQKKGRGGVFQEKLSLAEELPQLVVDMRLRGINTRYLLLLLTEVQHPNNKILVTTELIARHIKNQVREKWRLLGKVSDWKDNTPYIKIVCNYFNSIFGTENKKFWQNLKIKIANQNFPLAEKSIDLALPDENNIQNQVDIPSLFLRLQDLLGLKFNNENQYFINLFHQLNEPFKISQICDILPKIKYINRITFEEGTALSRLAMISKDDYEAVKLLELACSKYKETLAIRPNDTRALYNWGLSLSLLSAISQSEEQSHFYYNLAAKKYKEALVLNPKDRRALFMWANMVTEHAKTASHSDKIKMLEKVSFF